jgi:RNA polymerase sigma-70 factor (ECF subfamily)
MQTEASRRMNDTFEQIVEQYGDMVTRICYLHLNNISDAEDCWQNVFMKLYKAPKMWVKPPDELRRWLITITLNECRDAARKLFYRWHDNIDELVVPHIESFDKSVIDAVKRLPAKYFRVIYFHYYEGFSIEEMSRILGVKENTVKSQLMRGRKLLKGALRDD